MEHIFLIWNTFISVWRIGKGFWNIYNNHDKAYHGFVVNLNLDFFKII